MVDDNADQGGPGHHRNEWGVLREVYAQEAGNPIQEEPSPLVVELGTLALLSLDLAKDLEQVVGLS